MVIPLANEEKTLAELFTAITAALQFLPQCLVIMVVDNASKDNTYERCKEQASNDSRFKVYFHHNSRSVVDAYLAGFKQALLAGADCIIEMDGGMSHNPEQLPSFYKQWQLGYNAVFGSRFSKGGSLVNATKQRRFLSKRGTQVSNLLLATTLSDMTSGFEAFDAKLLAQIVNYPLKSRAHFFQTELRYLCRKTTHIEIPIIHCSPAKQVAPASILNAISCLLSYTLLRFTFNAPALKDED